MYGNITLIIYQIYVANISPPLDNNFLLLDGEDFNLLNGDNFDLLS